VAGVCRRADQEHSVPVGDEPINGGVNAFWFCPRPTLMGPLGAAALLRDFFESTIGSRRSMMKSASGLAFVDDGITRNRRVAMGNGHQHGTSNAQGGLIRCASP